MEIDHGKNLSTRYAHLSEIKVSEGDLVRQGSIIGLVGSMQGNAEPHLHFEIWYKNRMINPFRFLSK